MSADEWTADELFPHGFQEAEIETNIFDIEEIYPNCTVQILKNSVTGEKSIGWWVNE